MSGDTFGCRNWGGGGSVATGIYFIETRDETKRSTMHRTVPTAEKCPSQMSTAQD